MSAKARCARCRSPIRRHSPPTSRRGADRLTMPRLALDSPVGRLSLFEENGALAAVDWGVKRASGEPTPLLLEAKRQLAAYFAGKLHDFDLPLAPAGSPFERRVWELMSAIPYGETRSYGDLAAALGAMP